MYGLPYRFEICGPKSLQLLRSSGIAKEEKDVGFYVGLLVGVVVFNSIWSF